MSKSPVTSLSSSQFQTSRLVHPQHKFQETIPQSTQSNGFGLGSSTTRGFSTERQSQSKAEEILRYTNNPQFIFDKNSKLIQGIFSKKNTSKYLRRPISALQKRNGEKYQTVSYSITRFENDVDKLHHKQLDHHKPKCQIDFEGLIQAVNNIIGDDQEQIILQTFQNYNSQNVINQVSSNDKQLPQIKSQLEESDVSDNNQNQDKIKVQQQQEQKISKYDSKREQLNNPNTNNNNSINHYPQIQQQQTQMSHSNSQSSKLKKLSDRPLTQNVEKEALKLSRNLSRGHLMTQNTNLRKIPASSPLNFTDTLFIKSISSQYNKGSNDKGTEEMNKDIKNHVTRVDLIRKPSNQNSPIENFDQEQLRQILKNEQVKQQYQPVLIKEADFLKIDMTTIVEKRQGLKGSLIKFNKHIASKKEIDSNSKDEIYQEEKNKFDNLMVSSKMSATQNEPWLNSMMERNSAITLRSTSKEFSPKNKAYISPIKNQQNSKTPILTAFEFCPQSPQQIQLYDLAIEDPNFISLCNYLNQYQIQEDEIDATDQHILVHLPDGELSIAEKVAPMPRSKLICYHCKVILEFMAGAVHVQCGNCQKINRVPQINVQKAQCQKCTVLLQFPTGSRKVRCGVCSHVNNYS
ncbi:lsd1 like protein [Stylonychia lemnae]|uniref:Lsd1 like protein n=1 Tax=Stylonychia lemnae TaxID=5949 RepID=A0A078B8L3_STYLE|nr:lsd1 like protein [Stylonychia lemnae]|eukprot:CDW90860.1 lsd1 like protein [Stylonychia lemnae]